MSSKHYSLQGPDGGAIQELPVLEPTAGPNVIDIGKLYRQSGVFTFDPGFAATASCQSTITYIDGEQG
ncbi:MAG: citrate (Si)-synthase, partial [Gammaproteobacteria bacterium]